MLYAVTGAADCSTAVADLGMAVNPVPATDNPNMTSTTDRLVVKAGPVPAPVPIAVPSVVVAVVDVVVPSTIGSSSG